MSLFNGKDELIQYAELTLSNLATGLQKGVRHCILQAGADAPASVPALLYCFSVIDLLGAFYQGDATRRAPTTEQSGQYMLRFMGYTDEQVKLLQQMFRHKLVHLNQPQLVIHHGSQYISWMWHHEEPEKHLLLQELTSPTMISFGLRRVFHCDHIFHISIAKFATDIKLSIDKPMVGYLASLVASAELQVNFEKVVSTIFDF